MFQSQGLTKSMYNDQVQMAIPVSSITALTVIDEMAKKSLTFPEDAPSSWESDLIMERHTSLS